MLGTRFYLMLFDVMFTFVSSYLETIAELHLILKHLKNPYNSGEFFALDKLTNSGFFLTSRARVRKRIFNHR